MQRTKARWDELLPWLRRITKTRETIAAAATAGMVGAATQMQTRAAQTMAEAEAEIVVKGPEVFETVEALGGAFARMLQADSAIPGDPAAVAAWNDAKAVAQRWDRAADEFGAILAVDVLSAGQAATVFDRTTHEMVAALQQLMPAPATSPGDSP